MQDPFERTSIGIHRRTSLKTKGQILESLIQLGYKSAQGLKLTIFLSSYRVWDERVLETYVRLSFLVLLSASFVAQACSWNSSESRVGLLYQSTAENLSVTSKPVSATSGTGVACSVSYLGLIHIGDASVVAAMNSAGIKVVSVVDKTSDNILGIWGRRCTVVRGN